MRDPYSVLGVKRDAAAEEIKAAWRTKAKTVHPDQNRDDPSASERFSEIGRAYDLLKDPKKRGLYDQARKVAEQKQREQTFMQQRENQREAAARAKAAEQLMQELEKAETAKLKAAAAANPGSAQNSGSASGSATNPDAAAAGAKAETPEDMLERIFGAQARKQQARGQSDGHEEARAEADAEASSVAAKGAAALISHLFRRLTGAQPAPEKAPDITAEATVTAEDFLERRWLTVTLADGRDVRFQIEAGMSDGHVVRLKGQGLKLPGMQRGDLSVTLLAARDSAFAIHGYDIHTVLPLSLQDAVLGCEAEVTTPEGPLSITVPAWSGSDQTVHVADRGLPNDAGGRGDLVVELRIVLWEKPDEKVTDLMRLMRQGLFL